MKKVAVIYLVWAPYGCSLVQRFVDSYKRFPGCHPHRLVVVFNGCMNNDQLAELKNPFSDLRYEECVLDTPMQDIPAYFKAASRLTEDYMVILNSYSQLLCPQWLEFLLSAIELPDTGVAGATGSWASLYSRRRDELGLKSEYSGLLRKHEVVTRGGASFPRRLYRKIRSRLRGAMEIRTLSRTFIPFPSYHIRTNAFAIRREVFLKIKVNALRTKWDAWEFENGRNGFTVQLLEAGLQPRVVGKSGGVYRKEEWAISNTLWQQEQEELIVSDNQTGFYTDGDHEKRKFLSTWAWGAGARPSLSLKSE